MVFTKSFIAVMCKFACLLANKLLYFFNFVHLFQASFHIYRLTSSLVIWVYFGQSGVRALPIGVAAEPSVHYFLTKFHAPSTLNSGF